VLTFGDVNLWCQWLTSQGILKHGAKKQIAAMQEHSPVTIQDLDKLFSPAALDTMLAAFEGDYKGLMEWWRVRVVESIKIRVIRRPSSRVHLRPAGIRGTTSGMSLQAACREPRCAFAVVGGPPFLSIASAGA
jgi:hypothetical protein